MKNIIYTLIAIFISLQGLTGQEVNTKLSQAKNAYGSGKLDEARFELQAALVEIDKVIGAEILKILPVSMANMNYVTESDQVTGTGQSFAGLYVNRYYGSDEKHAEIVIISDSPLLAGVNTLLAMPAFMLTDDSQKRIKVDGYKALMQKSEGENGNVSWDVQIPFGSSLLTLTVSGITDESSVESMANTIPVAKIEGLTR